jgi:hypothetical protein
MLPNSGNQKAIFSKRIPELVADLIIATALKNKRVWKVTRSAAVISYSYRSLIPKSTYQTFCYPVFWRKLG